MANVLQSKRESSRFQILVEIAAHQPNLRQKEVASKLGVTPQAISEYIKELVADGLVTTDGRMRYSITKEGVEWLLESAAELKRYARVVMEEIISHVSVWTAIAESDLVEGERVSLEMRGGLLYANRKEDIEASGIIIASASAGEDVGISDLRGLISLEEGKVTLCKVPRVQMGGSRGVDLEVLKDLLRKERMVGCLGIEALVSSPQGRTGAGCALRGQGVRCRGGIPWRQLSGGERGRADSRSSHPSGVRGPEVRADRPHYWLNWIYRFKDDFSGSCPGGQVSHTVIAPERGSGSLRRPSAPEGYASGAQGLQVPGQKGERSGEVSSSGGRHEAASQSRGYLSRPG